MDNKDVVVPKEDDDTSLDVIENKEFRRWMQDDSSVLSESLRSVVDNILKDKRKKVQIFLLALVRNRIDKLAYLFKKEDVVKEALFSNERIDKMTNNQLISLFKLLHLQQKDILEFLDYISQQKIDASSWEGAFSDTMASELSHLTPESRNKIRLVLGKILSDDTAEGNAPPAASE